MKVSEVHREIAKETLKNIEVAVHPINGYCFTQAGLNALAEALAKIEQETIDRCSYVDLGHEEFSTSDIPKDIAKSIRQLGENSEKPEGMGTNGPCVCSPSRFMRLIRAKDKELAELREKYDHLKLAHEAQIQVSHDRYHELAELRAENERLGRIIDGTQTARQDRKDLIKSIAEVKLLKSALALVVEALKPFAMCSAWHMKGEGGRCFGCDAIKALSLKTVKDLE